jgi:t-SNARE syntaxin family protein
LLASYLRIRSSASSTSPELVEAKNELELVLKDLQTDLEDLVESVRAVELDPYSFGIDIDEAQRRRQLVDQVGAEVEKMQQELKMASVGLQPKGNLMGIHALPDPDTFDEDDDYAAAFEQQRQQEIIVEQDEALEGIFHTVGNIRQQAHVMGQELEEQGQLLEEVDEVADRVGTKLQTGLRQIGNVIRKNEGSYLLIPSAFFLHF